MGIAPPLSVRVNGQPDRPLLLHIRIRFCIPANVSSNLAKLSMDSVKGYLRTFSSIPDKSAPVITVVAAVLPFIPLVQHGGLLYGINENQGTGASHSRVQLGRAKSPVWHSSPKLVYKVNRLHQGRELPAIASTVFDTLYQ